MFNRFQKTIIEISFGFGMIHYYPFRHPEDVNPNDLLC